MVWLWLMQKNGEGEQAMTFVTRALGAGLPFERFTAGPREMLEPLHGLSAFRALKNEKNKLWVHGPILGAVTDRSASFWVRTERQASFAVELYPVQQGRRSKTMLSAAVLTKVEDDFTATVSGGEAQSESNLPISTYSGWGKDFGCVSVSDFPQTESIRSFFKVAFGGGAAYTPEFERVFTTIKSHQPVAFLQLGDNIYVDQPEKRAIQRYCYYRRQSSIPYRALASSVSIASIWDDHDFGDNDCWYGDDPDSPAWKRTVLKTFQENWNNHALREWSRSPGLLS